MDCGKVENCSVVRRIKIWSSFGKLGRHVIRTKEDKDNPSCYQRSVQKPSISDGMGLLWVRGHGQLTHLERHHQCWKVYPSSRTTYAPIQTSVSFREDLAFFQHDNARPHTASITTSWLRRRRIRVLKWPACSPDLSPIENIWRIIRGRCDKEDLGQLSN